MGMIFLFVNIRSCNGLFFIQTLFDHIGYILFVCSQTLLDNMFCQFLTTGFSIVYGVKSILNVVGIKFRMGNNLSIFKRNYVKEFSPGTTKISLETNDCVIGESLMFKGVYFADLW